MTGDPDAAGHQGRALQSLPRALGHEGAARRRTRLYEAAVARSTGSPRTRRRSSCCTARKDTLVPVEVARAFVDAFLRARPARRSATSSCPGRSTATTPSCSPRCSATARASPSSSTRSSPPRAVRTRALAATGPLAERHVDVGSPSPSTSSRLAIVDHPASMRSPARRVDPRPARRAAPRTVTDATRRLHRLLRRGLRAADHPEHLARGVEDAAARRRSPQLVARSASAPRGSDVVVRPAPGLLGREREDRREEAEQDRQRASRAPPGPSAVASLSSSP